MNPETRSTAKPLPPVELLRSFLSYDPGTGIVRWKRRPAKNVHAGDEAGTFDRASGYRRVSIQKKDHHVHRVIWKLVTGADPGDKELDHINGIRHDNRWSNLRLVDRATNAQNLSPKGPLGFVGITWVKRTKKFFASVRRNNVSFRLGSFTVFDQAAAAVRAKVVELDGFYNPRREYSATFVDALRAGLEKEALANAERSAKRASEESATRKAKRRRLIEKLAILLQWGRDEAADELAGVIERGGY